MKKIFIAFSLVIFTLLSITSCSSGSEDSLKNENPSAYELMETAFVGNPVKNDIQPMMERVMQRHKLDVNEENLQKVGSMLVTLRKASDAGVTEMEILEHIYQNGSDKLTLSEQAGISATLLESTK